MQKIKNFVFGVNLALALAIILAGKLITSSCDKAVYNYMEPNGGKHYAACEELYNPSFFKALKALTEIDSK